MVVGFNHNFKYKGEVYHLQSEDNGVKNPQIVTLLYSGGQILSARKTSYAELLDAPDLTRRVEELMKKQHQDMLRRLKNGDFDGAIAQLTSGSSDLPSGTAPPVVSESSVPMAKPLAAVEPAAVVNPDDGESDLEKLILSYLLGDDK